MSGMQGETIMDKNMIIRSSALDEAVESHYKRWKQKLGYFSMFAALPTLVGSPAETGAAPRDPVTGSIPARRITSAGGRPAMGCRTPELLRRKTGYLLPNQERRYDIV